MLRATSQTRVMLGILASLIYDFGFRSCRLSVSRSQPDEMGYFRLILHLLRASPF